RKKSLQSLECKGFFLFFFYDKWHNIKVKFHKTMKLPFGFSFKKSGTISVYCVFSANSQENGARGPFYHLLCKNEIFKNQNCKILLTCIL
ncbi:MAG TPA: hypothetical protein DD738_04695, partial [Ruminiclostridium sp.]|nr:hypothetical protein [Ruminiclostridium sp.]